MFVLAVTFSHGAFYGTQQIIPAPQDPPLNMVLVFTSVISAHLRSILLLHLMIFAVMTAVGFLLSHVILVYLRKTLMGLQPEELLSRYLQQDEVLGAMAEDLVASDTAGNILFANAAARKIIGGDRKMAGRPLAEFLPEHTRGKPKMSKSLG